MCFFIIFLKHSFFICKGKTWMCIFLIYMIVKHDINHIFLSIIGKRRVLKTYSLLNFFKHSLYLVKEVCYFLRKIICTNCKKNMCNFLKGTAND